MVENLGLLLGRMVHSGEVAVVGAFCERGFAGLEDHNDTGESLAGVKTRHSPSLQSPSHGSCCPLHNPRADAHQCPKDVSSSFEKPSNVSSKLAKTFKKAKLSNTVHTTDVNKWVCSQSFVLSRFLICKHLVHAKENDGQVPANFFRDVERRRCLLFGSFQNSRSRKKPSTLLPNKISPCNLTRLTLTPGARLMMVKTRLDLFMKP